MAQSCPSSSSSNQPSLQSRKVCHTCPKSKRGGRSNNKDKYECFSASEWHSETPNCNTCVRNTAILDGFFESLDEMQSDAIADLTEVVESDEVSKKEATYQSLSARWIDLSIQNYRLCLAQTESWSIDWY